MTNEVSNKYNKRPVLKGHFTVVCLVPRPLNRNEVEVDVVLNWQLGNKTLNSINRATKVIKSATTIKKIPAEKASNIQMKIFFYDPCCETT